MNKLFLLLLCLVALLPLPLAGARPMTWMWPAMLTFLLVILSAIQYLRGRVTVSVALVDAWPILLSLFAVGTWMALQLFGPLTTADSHATAVQLLKTLMYAAIFVLCLLHVKSSRELEILLWVIVLGGALQVIIRLLFDVPGTYVNRNHFAGYLEIAVALAIGLMISRFENTSGGSWRARVRGWIRVLLGPKIVIRVLIILLVVGLILSRSRMGNIGFFVGLGAAGLVGLWTFRHVSRSVLVFFGSILVLDVFLMGALFGIEKLQQRFQQLDIASDGRRFVNEKAWQLLQDDWLWGTGAGTFYAVFPAVRDERMPKFFQFAHNDFFQFPLELGLASILLAFCVCHAMVTAVRVQLVRRSQLMKSVGFAAFMGIVSIMAHSTADFNLQLTANAGTFMVLLALPYLALHLDRRSS